jgi:hypothetical protein
MMTGVLLTALFFNEKRQGWVAYVSLFLGLNVFFGVLHVLILGFELSELRLLSP